MEKSLVSELETAAETPGVVSAAAIDSSGLPLASRGAFNPVNSGVFVAAADKAAMLHPERESPVVVIDVEGGESFLIKQKQLLTTVIQKKN